MESLGQRVWVIAVDRNRALAWAQQNRPQCVPKIGHPDSLVTPRGLRIPNETVYFVDEPNQDVRSAWMQTGAKLVWV